MGSDVPSPPSRPRAIRSRQPNPTRPPSFGPERERAPARPLVGGCAERRLPYLHLPDVEAGHHGGSPQALHVRQPRVSLRVVQCRHRFLGVRVKQAHLCKCARACQGIGTRSVERNERNARNHSRAAYMWGWPSLRRRHPRPRAPRARPRASAGARRLASREGSSTGGSDPRW